MFNERKIKNRRFTPREFEDELLVSRIWRRRPRTYIFDPPDYELYKIPIFEPVVNFEINFKD